MKCRGSERHGLSGGFKVGSSRATVKCCDKYVGYEDSCVPAKVNSQTGSSKLERQQDGPTGSLVHRQNDRAGSLVD
jgi:hypothetical protein